MIGVGIGAFAVRRILKSRTYILGASGQGVNMSFTRASDAYRFTSAATLEMAPPNAMRLDWGPSGAGPSGWLFENSATNLLVWSVADTTRWSKTSASISGLTLGALGVFPGVSIVSSGQDYGRLNSNSVSVAAGQTYALSVWFRTGSSPNGRITIRDKNSSGQSVFGGEIGAFSLLSSGLGDINFESEQVFPDGSRRLVVTFQPTLSTSVTFGWGPYSAVLGQSTTLLAMQVEQGGTATSYIPTQGVTKQRAADVAQINGILGIRDLVVSFANGSVQTFNDVSLSEGYWPSLVTKRVTSITVE